MSLLRIGNDVVDLEHPRCTGRRGDDPLLDRILCDEEREWLGESGGGEVEPVRLWALWAAKEAGFKVRCKLRGGPEVLRFRAFSCRLEVTDAAGELVKITGTVRPPGGEASLLIEGTSDGRYLHVVARSGPRRPPAGARLEVGLEGVRDTGAADDELETFRDRFTSAEWEGVHSVPSARVRLLARNRIEANLGGPKGGVEILTSGDRPGRSPPRIRVGSVDRPDLDVSLSHHGRFVAWALFLPDRPDPSALES